MDNGCCKALWRNDLLNKIKKPRKMRSFFIPLSSGSKQRYLGVVVQTLVLSPMLCR